MCVLYMSGKAETKVQADGRRERAWTPVAIAALVTCGFAGLVAWAVVAGGVDGSGAAQPAGALPATRLLSGFVVVGVPALAAWGVSINHRCINVTVRRILLAIAFAMGAWLCAACIATVALDLADPPIMAIAVLSDLGIALVVEIYIDARIFPSIHRYRTLFRRLPFDLKIMNPGGRVIYKTEIARPLDNTTLWRLAQQAPSDVATSTPSVHSESLPDVVFKIYRLNAGTALLTENATQVNRLQERLEERRSQLTSQNEILRHNHAVQSLLYRQQRERELGERVERDLASTAAQIRNILDNRIVGLGPVVREERLKQLNLVKVLVAYSKRKGMLALTAAERETFTAEQLGVVAREAMADLHSIGIECALLVESSQPISIVAFNAIYDCFYDCILSVLPHTDPVVMTYITTGDDLALEMRAVIECAIGLNDENAIDMIPRIATSTASWTAVQMDIARDLEGRLATRGADFSIMLDDGLVNVTVRADVDGIQAGDAQGDVQKDEREGNRGSARGDAQGDGQGDGRGDGR